MNGGGRHTLHHHFSGLCMKILDDCAIYQTGLCWSADFHSICVGQTDCCHLLYCHTPMVNGMTDNIFLVVHKAYCEGLLQTSASPISVMFTWLGQGKLLGKPLSVIDMMHTTLTKNQHHNSLTQKSGK